MPAKAPSGGTDIAAKLAGLGARIRAKRKALRLAATTTAEAAGMSRVTLHRIERGEPAVTLGAWVAAAVAVGLEFELIDPHVRAKASRRLPAAIAVADYPQLRRLAWQLKRDAKLSPKEALELYERNWRHVDEASMTDRERALMRRLVDVLGGGRLLV